MSDTNAVSLLSAEPKYLLLSIDEKTGRQNAVSLIAYGANPDDPKETLIFTTSAPHIYQEISLDIPFTFFQRIMEDTAHLDVSNIGQTPVHIDPTSELGKMVMMFKNLIAPVMAPVSPSGMH